MATTTSKDGGGASPQNVTSKWRTSLGKKVTKDCGHIIFLIIFILTLPFALIGQTPTINKFSRTPCIENCKRWDTLYYKKYVDRVFFLNFGRRESCANYDTALVRIKDDTLRIIIGKKELLSKRTINGTTSPCFMPSDEEDCECFYDYCIDVTNLTTEPKVIIVDRRIYIDGKGFSLKKYRPIW